MKKKILSTALAGIMVMSLAACGGGNSGGGDSAGGGASSGDKGGKLSVAIWDNNQQAGLNEIIKDFTAATGIEADLQVIT